MIAGQWLSAIVIMAAGAHSSTEELAPAPKSASPATALTAGDDDPPAISPRLNWRPAQNPPSRLTVEVVGADPVALRALKQADLQVDRWNSFFAVKVVPEEATTTSDSLPVLGSYRVAGDALRFELRFPLEPGLRYRAEFDPVRLNAATRVNDQTGSQPAGKAPSHAKLFADYSIPKKPASAHTSVTEVTPTGDLLPENLLRFYIFFSGPMSRGEAYRRITLVNPTTGKPVDAPFLELDEELWSPNGTRFTLVFDPGRIKRGLKPREEVGPVLEAGRSYSLMIAREWRDASGSPLTSGYRKTFRVGPPDETSPDPKRWTIDAPPAGTRTPLNVRFPESLDRALLERLVWVETAEAKVVTGRITLGTAETTWRFTPETPWRAMPYRLIVGADLEDLAGNSVARPFEVDATSPISRRLTSKTVELRFEINAPRR